MMFGWHAVRSICTSFCSSPLNSRKMGAAITLMASSAPVALCTARYTAPLPPCPRHFFTSNASRTLSSMFHTSCSCSLNVRTGSLGAMGELISRTFPLLDKDKLSRSARALVFFLLPTTKLPSFSTLLPFPFFSVGTPSRPRPDPPPSSFLSFLFFFFHFLNPILPVSLLHAQQRRVLNNATITSCQYSHQSQFYIRINDIYNELSYTSYHLLVLLKSFLESLRPIYTN
mmetsp:Transcript_34238/g.96476  ORF Transcript_34238/g.96476 Transcript_34238/m.96476 type:complete len:229 (-) Transcript_34238:21-707(-)